MIKHLFYLLFVILITVGLATALQHDPGYILIAFHQWQIQTTLVIFILSLTLLLGAFFSLLTMFWSGLKLPKKMYQYYQNWQIHHQEEQIHQALEAFFQEDWSMVDKKLRSTQLPWYLNLLAAEAAQKQNSLQKRDTFIKLALDEGQSPQISILLFQTHLLIQSKQFEQAEAILNRIPPKIAKKNPFWYKLRFILNFHFKHYAAIIESLNQNQKLLKKMPWYFEFYQKALLKLIHPSMTEAEVVKLFKNSPKIIQENLSVMKKLSPWLTNQKVFNHMIEDLILEDPLSTELLQLLEELEPKESWIHQLEKQHHLDPQNLNILCCLGKLKAKQKLWGQALAYLKASKTKEAYLELAKIYLKLEQTANASEAMQAALRIETQE
jgi:HemY protein